jgi:ABC-type dipeptide/oligopeptide/nickel transport system permease subunit
MKGFAWLILGVIGIISLLAPLLATHDPLAIDLQHNLQKPSAEHRLGTDLLGRDIYSRTLYGGRQSLLLATGATLIAIVGGLVLGLLGSSRYWAIDLPLSSLIDALLAAPALLIALVVVTVLGSGTVSIILAVGIAGIGSFARTTQDALLKLQAMLYVESAHSIGATRQRIVLVHLLPNAYPILLAFAGVTFSWSLINSAALSFLGFVGDPNAPDWGVMLAAGRQTFAAAPYEALAAGVMLTLTVGAVNRLTR